MAFRISEDLLGIPALLEVDDILHSEFPDQFSIMTYLAQFYHLFYKPPSLGRDSGLSSFKNSSTEEEVVRRDGTVASLLELRRSRPVSWHGRGRLELRVQPHPVERENPFRHENSEDADDEMGEQQGRRGGLFTAAQQEVAVRRRRPSSLCGVGSVLTEVTTGRRWDKRYRRSAKRRLVGGQSHASIGHSDLPRPYQPREVELSLVKRRKSEDLVTEENICNETAMRLRESRDQMIERVVQVRDWQSDRNIMTSIPGSAQYCGETETAQN